MIVENLKLENFRNAVSESIDFCDGVNQYLVPALFLPVDGRNLYDLVLVYSAYCLSNDLDLDSDF